MTLILFRALDFDCYSYTTLEPGAWDLYLWMLANTRVVVFTGKRSYGRVNIAKALESIGVMGLRSLPIRRTILAGQMLVRALICIVMFNIQMSLSIMLMVSIFVVC